jgi:maleate isomerase
VLIEVYGVNAQMLGPVSRGSEMAGWVSVHSAVERTWSAADQEALSLASAQVSELLTSYRGS